MGSRNGNKYDHWTEYDSRVLSYLHEMFGEEPEKMPDGADLTIGGIRIEVKACNEWNKTNHANGNRRRGRFRLAGYEDCDFFLFVLVRRNGDVDMKTFPAETIERKFDSACSISWNKLFVTH